MIETTRDHQIKSISQLSAIWLTFCQNRGPYGSNTNICMAHYGQYVAYQRNRYY